MATQGSFYLTDEQHEQIEEARVMIQERSLDGRASTSAALRYLLGLGYEAFRLSGRAGKG